MHASVCACAFTVSSPLYIMIFVILVTVGVFGKHTHAHSVNHKYTNSPCIVWQSINQTANRTLVTQSAFRRNALTLSLSHYDELKCELNLMQNLGVLRDAYGKWNDMSNVGFYNSFVHCICTQHKHSISRSIHICWVEILNHRNVYAMCIF